MDRSVMTVEVPCKIGDELFGVRCYKGVYHPQLGIVHEMYFTRDMSLHIVLKHICRGEYGKDVFSDYDLCKAECERRNTRCCRGPWT